MADRERTVTSPSFDEEEFEGDDDGGGGGGAFSVSWGDLSLPSWLTNLKSVSGTLRRFGENPQRFIRGILVGWLLSGIAAIASPFFEALQLVFLGSNPSTFAAPTETWGLADLPAVLLGFGGDVVQSLITAAFDIAADTIEAVTPADAGPLTGLLFTLLVIAIVVGVTRIGIPTLRVGLEAIPVVGGPLSTLIEVLR